MIEYKRIKKDIKTPLICDKYVEVFEELAEEIVDAYISSNVTDQLVDKIVHTPNHSEKLSQIYEKNDTYKVANLTVSEYTEFITQLKPSEISIIDITALTDDRLLLTYTEKE